jgi:hypothetical protein
MFITLYTRARRWSLPSIRWIQRTDSHPVASICFLILSRNILLDLLSDLYPSRFPAKTSLPYVLYAMPISFPLILFFDLSQISESKTFWALGYMPLFHNYMSASKAGPQRCLVYRSRRNIQEMEKVLEALPNHRRGKLLTVKGAGGGEGVFSS